MRSDSGSSHPELSDTVDSLQALKMTSVGRYSHVEGKRSLAEHSGDTEHRHSY